MLDPGPGTQIDEPDVEARRVANGGENERKDSTVTVADPTEDPYQSGVPLRNLSQSEIHQFPGLKREHWW